MILQIAQLRGRRLACSSELEEGAFFNEPLLKELTDIATRPDNVYSHRWETDDILMWDNRCTLHYAVKDFEHSSPRHMVRMAVLGTPLGRIVEDATAGS